MKRRSAIILSAMLILGCFTGCSNTPAQNSTPAQTASDKTSEQTADSDQSTAGDTGQTDTSQGQPEGSENTSAQTSAAPAEASTAAAPKHTIDEYTPRSADWVNIQWTQYTSPYFTLMIPSGWNVDWSGNTEQLYWSASNPDATVGVSNRDHLNMPKTYESMMNCQGSGYVESGMIDDIFRFMYSQTTESFEVVSYCTPSNYDTLQAMRPNDPIRDYRSLYVKFVENGRNGEGLYSGVVMESPAVIFNGADLGFWEVNCLLGQYAPEGQFVNWAPVLAQIIQSFTYTDLYYQEKIGSTQQIDDSPVDTGSVLEAFEQRSTEETIRTEKYSDMIGEYERVYDNESGEIYRAYNGFLQDIGTDQTRYSAITDSQYAQGYVGWIDKPGS